MGWVVTVIGLCLASGGYYVIGRIGRRRDWWASAYTRAGLLQMAGVLWVATILQLVFVRVIENRSLHSIGLRPVGLFEFVAGVGIACFVLMCLGCLPEVILQQFGRALPNERDLYLLAQPAYVKVVLGVTAGVTGVVLFNGYVLERVLELTGEPLWAVAVSTVVAARSNLPLLKEIRLAQVPTALTSSLVLALLYLFFRNVLVVAGGQTLLSVLVFLSNSPEDALFGRELSDFDDRVVRAVRNTD